MSVEAQKQKQIIIDEIKGKLENAQAAVVVDYMGITVAQADAMRKKLREANVDYTVYKNTLVKRAIEGTEFEPMTEVLEGPNAILFGTDLLEPIKIISKYAKDHNKLDIRVGVISGKVADKNVIKEYASIPSREGLLTMLASGMIAYVKDLSIALNLYAEKMEGEEKYVLSRS